MPDWLVPALQFGLPGLGIGGLIGSYATYRFDRIKERTKYRRELIAEWRSCVLDSSNVLEYDFVYGRLKVLGTVEYWSLRPHLSTKFREELESGKHTGGPFYPRPEFSDEIARIERKWGLV